MAPAAYARRDQLRITNNTIVNGGVFRASLFSDRLLNCSGGSEVAGRNAVRPAILAFLVLAGGSLIWLMLPKDA